MNSASTHVNQLAAVPSRCTIDAPTRAFHWLLALSFVGAYASSDSERWRLLHVTLGYTMLGLLVARVLWGLIGPRHARLSLMLGRLRGISQWWAGFTPSKTQARQGLALAMAACLPLLLLLVLLTTTSGLLGFNEWPSAAWVDALNEVHEFMGNSLLAVVLAHLGLIAILSVLRRKNQAAAMLTGRVEGRGPDLVRHNRLAWAVALCLAVLMFWTWQWQTASVQSSDAPAQQHQRSKHSR